MNQVIACLVRFIVILAGYIVACVAASTVMTILFTAAFLVPAELAQAGFHGPLVFAIPLVTMFVAYFAFLPSAAFILLSEVLGKRDWLFHALGGAAVSVAVIGYIWRATSAPYDTLDATYVSATPDDLGPLVLEPAIAATLIAAGMCGGIAYWLVAGRSAGSWRQPRRDVTSSAP